MGRGLALSKAWLAKFTIKKPSSVTFSFDCESFASSYPNKFAVTVPLIAGREPMVTLLEMEAVTEPIWFVPAGRAEPMVTELVMVAPKVTDVELASP